MCDEVWNVAYVTPTPSLLPPFLLLSTLHGTLPFLSLSSLSSSLHLPLLSPSLFSLPLLTPPLFSLSFFLSPFPLPLLTISTQQRRRHAGIPKDCSGSRDVWCQLLQHQEQEGNRAVAWCGLPWPQCLRARRPADPQDWISLE